MLLVAQEKLTLQLDLTTRLSKDIISNEIQSTSDISNCRDVKHKPAIK